MPTETFTLIRNYYKSTLRMISKNKIYSVINIMGLALGIAACLFILQYASYEKSYDRFHANHEDLYRVRYQVYRAGTLEIDCAAAVPRVGPFMKEKMPEVVDYARAYPMSAVVTYREVNFREDRVHIADPAFLEIFSFPMISGNASGLSEPNKVVISESAAKKYFRGEDPLGKTLEFDGDDQLEVVGVAKNVPNNSHIKFDFVISYETLNNGTRNDDGTSASETSWGWYDFNTYVLLRPGTDRKDFDVRFNEYLLEERGERFRERNYRAEFPLQPITDIHLYSNLLQESEPEEQGDGDAVAFVTIIAVFILVIAWINYLNLSTARSVDRAREVGLRKTFGATRRQLIYQFLIESFVLNTIALIIALVIMVLGIRYFNMLTDSSLSLAFLRDINFWLSISGILFLGSLVSGTYPAFVLSSYRPVSVLQGKIFSYAGGNPLRKGLVVFQFAASTALIACTIFVFQQLKHMQALDLGFDMTETLVVKGPEVIEVDSIFELTNRAFKSELVSNAGIGRVSNSSNVPGSEIFWTNGIKRDEDPADRYKIIYNVGVDYNYFDTYQIEIVEGRNYGESFSMDTAALIINEAAAAYLGFEGPEDAVGKKVTFWGDPKTIVGVVDNYNQMSPKAEIAPIAFPLVKTARSFYTIKLTGGNYQQLFREVQDTYDAFFPGNPFDYFFLDQYFNRQYDNERKFSRVFILFAAFAIFVACLGLFGLSSFTALKRSKEIGIRKVLGANVPNILQLLSREYVLLVVLSNLVALPVIYYVMNQWLNNFANRISMEAWVFIVAAIIVCIIALITVSYKIVQAAITNPIEAIRWE